MAGADEATGANGRPITGAVNASANVTVGHTWLIIVGAIVLLWLLGSTVFKSVRI